MKQGVSNTNSTNDKNKQSLNEQEQQNETRQGTSSIDDTAEFLEETRTAINDDEDANADVNVAAADGNAAGATRNAIGGTSLIAAVQERTGLRLDQKHAPLPRRDDPQDPPKRQRSSASSVGATSNSAKSVGRGSNENSLEQQIRALDPLNSERWLLTNRPALPLYLSADFYCFSDFQILIRRNIEFFEATTNDVLVKQQQKTKPIVLGQVGIRCAFCSSLHPLIRPTGAVAYPFKRSSVYQACQNMANIHWMEHCAYIPLSFREELMNARRRKSKGRANASKQAWVERCTALGIYEDEIAGLRFANSVNAFVEDFAKCKDQAEQK